MDALRPWPEAGGREHRGTLLGRLAAVIAICACGGALATLAAADAAVHHHHTKKRVVLHGLAAPGLLAPANGAHVQQFPVLSWAGVAGAAEYEYQLSADPRFESIVLGSGPGTGTSITHNVAAALSKSATDGNYYWRVRALTAAKQPGPWSATPTLVKAWTAAPQLLGPPGDAAVTWPSVPLVLSWSAVPGATEYIVSVATDPTLSNLA